MSKRNLHIFCSIQLALQINYFLQRPKDGAERAFCSNMSIDPAEIYFKVKRSQCHLLAAIENCWLEVPIARKRSSIFSNNTGFFSILKLKINISKLYFFPFKIDWKLVIEFVHTCFRLVWCQTFLIKEVTSLHLSI